MYIIASRSPIQFTVNDVGTGPNHNYPDITYKTITVSSSTELYSVNSSAPSDYNTYSYTGYGPNATGTTSFSTGYVLGCWSLGLGDGGGGGGGEQDDTPPDPTQPRQPIDWPDITLPSLPDFTITNNYTTTSGDIDWYPVTSRLDAINANLELFYDSFNSYRADLLEFWDSLGAALDGFDARFFRMSEQLREVIQWLRNIYDMLAASSGRVAGDMYEINNYYTPTLDGGNTPQQQLNADASRLKGKFPFSVPWDLYALLQFLEAPRAAPVFTFTLPLMGTLTCDLSVLDDVAAVCRWGSLFAFGAGLVYKTKDLIGYVSKFAVD